MEIKFDKEEQERILGQFFSECVAFWEKELDTSSDYDKEPYEKALAEVPHYHPYICRNAPMFSDKVRNDFIRHRCMDIYGRNWKLEYYKMFGSLSD